MKLKHKTWIFIILFSFVTITGIVSLTNYLYESFYVDNQIEQLKGRGDNLAAVYHQAETEEEKARFHELADFMSQCAVADIELDSAENIANGDWPEDIPILTDEPGLSTSEAAELQNGQTVVSQRTGEEDDHLLITLPLIDEEGLDNVIVISTPVTAAFAPFESLQGVLFLIGAGAFLLIVFILNKVVNYMVHPIERMIEASKTWAQGDFTQKVDVNSSDEIGDLAAAFNTMSQSLAEEDQKKQEFLGNVSHELRTPLSYLKGYSEVLLEAAENNQPVDTAQLHKIKMESERMERLVNDLLDLARLEGDLYPMSSAPIPFAQLIDDVVDRMRVLAEKQGIEIDTDLSPDIIINGDEQRLEQVITNLLQNAVNYGKEGKRITVRLYPRHDKAVFEVADQGEGIPKDVLNRLTERFYRMDKSRSKQSGGTGLGLSIVNEIIKKHHGEMSFESELGKGTTAKVELPLFTE
ncbi:sensor histidine kinase [Salisediminibacterium halotolerans]|uniref:sensor histidine kinase n=1 Tax=Salisediminibacterium halotolerans TaxID=517425 RepID=UPI000F2CC681|nr:HAMP domain-containing sensor histidine kinase [Salisediminibacterium halotolerans]RLJ81065.1 signal transduction histidine kinase [Actinophytocola xinjiangensis]RPE84126.1 signal transduction histidine kinase [Salisediminibacterium halotolerans]TWG38492.1 signal transduction histidine kinase [Salisediminibacterium halotolerans]GEL09240.1 two-component sensor histidine kinase [Salisediminibacterium halotolerans]